MIFLSATVVSNEVIWNQQVSAYMESTAASIYQSCAASAVVSNDHRAIWYSNIKVTLLLMGR